MESSAGSVAPPLKAQPSQPPGWLWFIGWTIFAAVVSAVLVALGLLAMADLRLLPDTTADQITWPWKVDGIWALAADLGYGLLYGFALAWTIRMAVRGRRDGWDLRLWPIACAVALAAASDPARSGSTALVLVVVVARQLALRPARAVQPQRRVRVAIVAGVAALLVATFSYQPLHPLLASFPGQRNHLMVSDYALTPPSSRRALPFRLENAGMGAVTLRSVRVVGPNARLLDIVPYGMRFEDTSLARNSDFDGRVRLSRAACATDAARGRTPSAAVDALIVRVETLGMVRTQRFDVSPRAGLYCR